MDKTKYNIIVGGEDFVLSLPTTKSAAIATLAAAKYNNIGAIIAEREDSPEGAAMYDQYRAWHALCAEAVKDINFAPLNAAANAQIEAERIASEKEAKAKAEAEAKAKAEADAIAEKESEEARKKAEEERKYYEEHIAPVERFNNAKSMKLAAIDAYDKSENVNGFSINGISGWLDRDTRTSLVNTINVEKAAGMEQTTLWFDTNALTLPCDLVLQMLSALEIYAHQCYNVTAQHKANVMALDTIEAIEAYEHTSGYPEKLSF